MSKAKTVRNTSGRANEDIWLINLRESSEFLTVQEICQGIFNHCQVSNCTNSPSGDIIWTFGGEIEIGLSEGEWYISDRGDIVLAEWFDGYQPSVAESYS